MHGVVCLDGAVGALAIMEVGSSSPLPFAYAKISPIDDGRIFSDKTGGRGEPYGPTWGKDDVVG